MDIRNGFFHGAPDDEVKYNPDTGLPDTRSGLEAQRYTKALKMFQADGDESVPFDKYYDEFKKFHPKSELSAPNPFNNSSYNRLASPILIQYPVPSAPNNNNSINDSNNTIKELRDKMAGLEKDNKEFQDYMKKLMLNEDPRIIRSLFPTGQTYIDRYAVVDDYEKRRVAQQTLSKLRDIYGTDASSKYLERSLARIGLPKVEYDVMSATVKPATIKMRTARSPTRLTRKPHKRSPTRKASTKTRSRSKSKSKSKSK